MGSQEDREHFQQYRRQTEIKHQILEKYIPAFFNVLKRHQNNLVYIDAFAGRGTYSDPDSGTSKPGSPIRAIRLVAARPALARKVSFVFSESDAENFRNLELAVASCSDDLTKIRKPELYNCTFRQLVRKLEEELGGTLSSLAPAFLFVDPCGIDGTDFGSIVKVVRQPRCEAFIFFNISGLRRTAGLIATGHLSDTIVGMYRDEATARALCDRMTSLSSPIMRENAAIDLYRALLLDEAGVEYVLPFRVESEQRNDTSHYLIHVSKHPIGFRIMKDVMWDLGCDPDDPGGLHLLQSSSGIGPQLIDSTAHSVDEVIRSELALGIKQVTHFTQKLPERPYDMVAPKYYRARLLSLEAAGEIEVCLSDKVVPPIARRPRLGKPTLADKYSVRLAGNHRR